MKAKYDKIGATYNLTRKADKYLTERIFYLLSPKKDGLYLDIGCGTGDYTHALFRKGVDFIGIDPSMEMLEQAKIKNPNIDWKLGTAEDTGLKNNSVDGIMASLTIHHWTDLGKAFLELYRVLKPGGHLVIFTATPEQMKGYWLNHYFPKMLADSIRQMPAMDLVTTTIKSAGFNLIQMEPYSIRPDLHDLFLYSGKHAPELYFKPEVRAGISSFSALANTEEVAIGLRKLRVDIDNGQIRQVKKSYENQGGDYLFMRLKK